ncbi:zinc ribbon domain-containing protein [Chimaeribacter arupi]|uniref:zinc ribbon domain-containing protein n=1 Tax=Chimaeribacter arupi TaxID=2060066 RepID=UPI0011AF0A6E|nr:zinc-ribbon domain-containing protein [Chimaeribacter arupi]
MAIKKCRKCASKIPDDSKFCPHCGVKNPSQPTSYMGVLIIVFIMFFIGCQFFSSDKNGRLTASAAEEPSLPLAAVALKRAPATNIPPADTGKFTTQAICKAAIAGIMEREIKGMKVSAPNKSGVVYVSYKRQQDGKKFSYQCKLSDDYVIWSEKGNESDRWLGHGEVEVVVMFTVTGNDLTIFELYIDDTIKHHYTLNQLK